MIRRYLALAALTLASSSTNAKIYFEERFNDNEWTDRWTIPSNWKSKGELGEWSRTAGEWHGPDSKDTAIRTKDDMRFYGISAPLTEAFNNKGKDLIIQYTVKTEELQDCGGAYIKLLPGGDAFDADSFGGDAPYAIMFGPDQCGGTKRTHVILRSETKDENILISDDIPYTKDRLSHLYRLHLKSDDTYSVTVDGAVVREGSLSEDFALLHPMTIPDPEVSKPDDWVDDATIDDPNDLKPDGWDDIQAEIPDPSANKPEDWDDEEDGEWEVPLVPNPDFKGVWSPKRIPNPDYKGVWVHPEIPNPDYVADDQLHAVCGVKPCTHVGFELWQVKSSTMFDDIMVTDDLAEATKFAEETYFAKKDNEKLMYDKVMGGDTYDKVMNGIDEDEDEFDMDSMMMGGDEL